MTHDPLTSAHRARLGVIRIAMLAGVIVFGAVTWFIRRDAAAPGISNPALLRTIGWVVFAVAVLGMGFMRQRVAAARDAATYGNLAVIGWAFGELAALFGAVYYFVTGDPTRFVTGIMLMLASFVLIPLRKT